MNITLISEFLGELIAKDYPKTGDLAFIEKSIELSRKVYVDQSSNLAATLSNNALWYAQVGDYFTAIDYQLNLLFQ